MRAVTISGGVLLVLVGVAFIAFRTARMIHREVYPSRQQVPAPPAVPELEGLKQVSFAGPDLILLKGWFVPPRDGAVVVLGHGLSQTRAQLLPEARLLAQAGYGVLMFDFAAHGESGGQVSTYGDREAAQLRAAVDFVVRQPGVDPGRIGALGFSLGGQAVLKAAAEDERIKAVVVQAAAVSVAEDLEKEVGHFGPLRRWPAEWVLSRAGVDVHAVRPRDFVRAMGKRPLMLVGGEDDPWVPVAAVEALAKQAEGPHELFIVKGAQHGGFIDAAPEEYPRRVLAFFERSL